MTEQRRKYAHNRVLIDSARVLSAQFDDAVIYVTGAQLELLRNVTQYLNRVTTYVSETHAGYYLTPDDEDMDEILEMVADLEEVLMGNPNTIWGYADQWTDGKNVTGDGTSPLILDTTAVPAGYVYKVEYIHIVHTDATGISISITFQTGSVNPILDYIPNLAASDHYSKFVNWTFKEGDKVRASISNLASGQTLYMNVSGYKMVVPD